VNTNKLVHWFIITTFVSLYAIVSIISTIHVIDFFSLSNPSWLAISLAIAFEIGAAASLSSLIIINKMNKSLVWGLFFILTAMQMMGNTYYAFTNLNDYQSWVELFGLVDEDPLYQKRILSIISGAILPLVALGFIKSLVDYIKPENENKKIIENVSEIIEKKVIQNEEKSKEIKEEPYKSKDLEEDIADWERASLEDFIEEYPFEVEPIEDALGIEEPVTEDQPVATQEVVNFVKDTSDAMIEFPGLEKPAIEEESSEIDITNKVEDEEKKSLI
jgi:hypothetical protein